jgi:signal transduction histidine kinase
MRIRPSIGTTPLLLMLAAVVLTPAAGVLWFMNEAMANQRLAARQKLAEAYGNHLLLARDRLDSQWESAAAALDAEAAVLAPDALFARAIQAADSAICYGPDGERIYPAPPQLPEPETSPAWMAAQRLEDARNLLAAAEAYAAIGGPRALQAQARCLARAGKRETAVSLVWSRSDAPPQLELLALQLMNASDPRRLPLARRLHTRLTDYGSGLAGGERLFLMHETQRMKLAGIEFPTLKAEQMAARAVENPSLPGVWKLWSPQKRVLLLFSAEGLAARLKSYLAEQAAPGGLALQAVAPGESAPGDSVELARFPGWRLGMVLPAEHPADAIAQQRTLWYLWIGCLAIAGASVAAVLAGQTMRRQMQLAGVKADLVATVSHELKTPLSSMRLLVDTLLEQAEPDPAQTREYLEMISRENARLSRLIEQFLTFSRMERKKHVFDFAGAQPEEIARSAVEAMRERLGACDFHQEIEPGLPQIRADAPSLVTALVNLLDNAWKYSPGEKSITLRVSAGGGRVRFAVQDRGIGIPPREARKIFRKFYQADRTLSRQAGGVGLGLSIVRLVAEAHNGSVDVDSRPGEGSTFTISVAEA